MPPDIQKILGNIKLSENITLSKSMLKIPKTTFLNFLQIDFEKYAIKQTSKQQLKKVEWDFESASSSIHEID